MSEEIVKSFLSHGFQISHDALQLVDKQKLEKILSGVANLKPRPFIVTKNHIEKIIEGKTQEIKLIKEFRNEKKELKTDDYTKHFTEIYEKIKEILLKNKKLTGLVSINKITKQTNNFSIIVLVRERTTKNILAEDPTGETHLYFNENIEDKLNGVEIDDVVGFVCERMGDEIYVKEVVYPDVSITRKINKTKNETRLLYIYKPSLFDDKKFEKILDVIRKTKKTDPIFIFGGWEDRERLKEFNNLFLIADTPSMFDIQGVKILSLPEANISQNTLDKRMIKNNLLNTFMVEDIPDIILSSEEKTYFKNYKGSTIISNKDKDKYFIVNLKDRSVEEIKF